MLQISNLTIGTAIANQSGAMEANTISKNGRNLKSQMNRRSFNTSIILIFAFLCFSTSAFSQTEKSNILDFYYPPNKKIILVSYPDATMKDLYLFDKQNLILKHSLYMRNLYGTWSSNGSSERKITIKDDTILEGNEIILKLPNANNKAELKYGTAKFVYLKINWGDTIKAIKVTEIDGRVTSNFYWGENRGLLFAEMDNKMILYNSSEIKNPNYREIDYAKEEKRRIELERQNEIFSNKKEIDQIKAVRYHKVEGGETLSDIARKYGTLVEQLCELNRIKPTTTLQIGRVIRIR